MAAGHPKTRGKICMKDHPNYIPGWSFIDSSRKSTDNNPLLMQGRKSKTDDNPFAK